MQNYDEQLPFPRWFRLLGAMIVVFLGLVGLYMAVVDDGGPIWERVVGGLALALGFVAGVLPLLLRQHNHVREDGTVTVGFPPLWRARLRSPDVSVEPADSVHGLEYGLGVRLLGNRTTGVIASPGPCVVLHGRSRRYLVRTDCPEDFIAAVGS